MNTNPYNSTVAKAGTFALICIAYFLSLNFSIKTNENILISFSNFMLLIGMSLLIKNKLKK